MDLNYRETGSGEPLIILHGLFGSSDNWQSFAKQLSNDFHILSPDQRNHGESFHDNDHNYKTMAEDLNRFYKKQDIEKAHVMGHSMGGKTAMKFALENPNKVDKLVIVDIAPKKYPVHHDYIIEAMCALDIKKYERRKNVDKALSDEIPNKAVRQFLLKNLERRDNGKLKWKINLPVLKKNLKNISEEINSSQPFDGPALFIAGELSDYVKSSDEPGIKSLFPNANITYLKNTGHWIHAEAPDKFLQTVSFFLKN